MRLRSSPNQTLINPLQSLILRRWRPQWVCHSCRQQQPQLRRGLATGKLSQAIEKPYYVTTPIFYVNAAPHVGHMYSMLLADVLKRWQQLKGERALLLTGTDEHGLKIQQAAGKAGIEPRAFCDKGAEMFKDLAAQIDMKYDTFIRTSDDSHKAAVEYAWQILQQRGYIYESKHEGWYSISDEAYYPAKDVHLIVDPPTGRKIMVSKETGKEVEWTVERNYRFRLSAFREPLLKWYEQNPEWIVPMTRMNDVVQEVTRGLEDLSVSRPVERLTWGVRVPTDDSQTIYVWLDALLNYASAAGFPFTPGSEASGGWPADVHVIGKDIVRFHCIYWPAFLMALDLPLPKQILTHAHWTLGKQKMAKSTGNVVNPFFAIERFGADPLRFFLIQEGGIADDSDYENAYIISKYKKDLQNGLGNLTARVMKPKGWDVYKAVKRFTGDRAIDPLTVKDPLGTALSEKMYRDLQRFPTTVEGHMRNLLPNRALKAISNEVYRANSYMQAKAPWSLATKLRSIAADTTGQEMRLAEEQDGQSPEDLEAQIDATIYLTAESLRLLGIALQPFMPTSASRMLDMIGVQPDRRTWHWCAIGRDDNYGTPLVKLEKGEKGMLFPGLVCEH